MREREKRKERERERKIDRERGSSVQKGWKEGSRVRLKERDRGREKGIHEN